MLHNCFSNNLVKKNRNYKCNTRRIRSQFALRLTIKTQGVECYWYRVTEDRFLELEKIIHYRCPTVRSRVVISISLSYDPIKLMLVDISFFFKGRLRWPELSSIMAFIVVLTNASSSFQHCARHPTSVTWLTSSNFPLKSCNRTGSVLISLADLIVSIDDVNSRSIMCECDGVAAKVSLHIKM